MTTRSLGRCGAWAADWLATAAAAAARMNLRIEVLIVPLRRQGPRLASIAALARWSRLPPLRERKSSQLRPKPLVHQLRVRLALHRLHRLPDEESEQLLFAGFVVRDLVGVGAEHLVDLGIDGARVAGLLEASFLDDLA